MKGILIAVLVQKLQRFCGMGGFCLPVELHRQGSAWSLYRRLVSKKHQCALIDHNIFMKQIDQFCYTKSLTFFLRIFLYFCGCFWVFFLYLKTLFLRFSSRKLSCNADIKMPYCIKVTFFDVTNIDFFKCFWNDTKYIFLKRWKNP